MKKERVIKNKSASNILDNIRWLRKRLKVSQKEMSEALEYSVSNYGKIENGSSKLTILDFILIAKVLKWPCSSFFKDHKEFTTSYENSF